MDRDDALLDYLQDRLAPDDRKRFETAMANDAALSAEVDLMRSVRTELASAPKHRNAEAVWDRLSTAIDAPPQAANENRSPWLPLLKYAAVAAFAVAVWQSAVVPRIGEAPDTFRAASEQSVGFVLQVKFLETATIGEITALLLPLNGTIVDGPSALGLVRVAFAEEATQQDAIDALGARDDLVELVLEQ